MLALIAARSSTQGLRFIRPDDGGAHVFARVQQQLQWQEQRSSVTRGSRVSYVAVLDHKYGKPRASTWTRLDHGPSLFGLLFGTGSHWALAPPGPSDHHHHHHHHHHSSSPYHLAPATYPLLPIIQHLSSLFISMSISISIRISFGRRCGSCHYASHGGGGVSSG